MKRACILVGLLASLFLFHYSADAYTYRQTGVDSNFLIAGGRVIFAQADQSLTALDLATGQVLTRNKDAEFDGTLRELPEGIFISGYDTAAMLDKKTLATLWKASECHDSYVAGNRMVSGDGNGLVQCRNLEDGKILWSYNLPGAVDFVVCGGKVLVHRSGTYIEEDTPTIVLLDLENGAELFKKTTPPGIHYFRGYFDGVRAYFEAGKDSSRRSEAITEQIVIWDPSGKEIGKHPFPYKKGEKKRYAYTEESFEFDGKIFAESGHVLPKGKTPPSSPSLAIYAPYRSEGAAEEYPIDNGKLIFDTIAVSNKQQYPTVRLVSSTNHWQGFFPDLRNGRITQIAEAGSKLLFGSNLGHVECIEAGTGKSTWMYVFPTIRQTMSYTSPGGMPPYVETSAKIFHEENDRSKLRSGLRLVPNGQSLKEVSKAEILSQASTGIKPTIIFDPEPYNPYEDLPKILALAWSGAGLPALLLTVMYASKKARNGDPRLQSGLCLVLLCFSGFILYRFGRVAMLSTLSIKITILVVLAVGLFSVWKACRNKCWWSGIAILAGLLGVFYFLLPALRYA